MPKLWVERETFRSAVEVQQMQSKYLMIAPNPDTLLVRGVGCLKWTGDLGSVFRLFLIAWFLLQIRGYMLKIKCTQLLNLAYFSRKMAITFAKVLSIVFLMPGTSKT